MIPKVIHYCWFGGKPLPESALRCIDSWRKHMPDCEIKRWDETNYDINAVRYTREAAERGKWAFVSDYARFDILNREGGIYFDTDVEMIAPIHDIIARGAFMGWENSSGALGVAAGLGMASPAGMPFLAEVIDHYRGARFVDDSGDQLPGTVVSHVTGLLKSKGLKLKDTLQTVDGVTVYPSEYFNPLEDTTGRLRLTSNSRTIHHYAKTWCDGYSPLRMRLSRLLHRWFGTEIFTKIRKITG